MEADELPGALRSQETLDREEEVPLWRTSGGDMFFSRAVTSSPIKQRPSEQSCRRLELSLLSADSTYSSFSSCSCRRSPRLLSNGYYVLTEDSVSWDEQGNVSLSPSKTSVSYKENLVRIFRRRRRSRRSLSSLLSDVSGSCQSWLDETIFRGVFGVAPTEPPAELETSAKDLGCSFIYDHTEAASPPDKEAPPPQTIIQEVSFIETCHSQEQFSQSLGGLAEVQPPSAFHNKSSCSQPTENSGSTSMTTLFTFILAIFLFSSIYCSCSVSGLVVAAAAFIIIFMFVTRPGSSGSLWIWRRAKTEDISSRNE